ncbi:MAG: hypothetical protein DMG65_07045 [Candidatus Angelobacter sp. Gp1-AA117]|nr:MAG: hypothetical protein DMG65_07045 [Candidatus Angelobacter sp. Gp1-AA117]
MKRSGMPGFEAGKWYQSALAGRLSFLIHCFGAWLLGHLSRFFWLIIKASFRPWPITSIYHGAWLRAQDQYFS